MIRCTVEFFGVPRQLLGLSQAELELGDDANLRQVLARLVEIWPQLHGRITTPEGERLLPPYTFNLNGHHFATNLDTKVQEADRILLMMASLGG